MGREADIKGTRPMAAMGSLYRLGWGRVTTSDVAIKWPGLWQTANLLSHPELPKRCGLTGRPLAQAPELGDKIRVSPDAQNCNTKEQLPDIFLAITAGYLIFLQTLLPPDPPLRLFRD